MAGLLKLDSRPPNFTLQQDGNEKRLSLREFLRKRRIVLLFMPTATSANLAAASFRSFYGSVVARFSEMQRRDLTVLVFAASPSDIPESRFVPPAPHFQILRDTDGKVTAMYGGAPAFYLIGKDGGIKEARRTCPKLAELFSTVDKMPMRKQEMRERGG